MSIGLRLLLDQNSSRITALQKAGYKPALSTIVLAGVGIAAMYVPSLPSPPSYFISTRPQTNYFLRPIPILEGTLLPNGSLPARVPDHRAR